MATGPILSRELLTAARRGGTYRRRCLLASVLLLALSLLFGTAHTWTRGELSIREMAGFSSYVFGFAAQCQVLLTLWLVPACVASAIAGEEERRTLADLLTTRLSSAEIVLGKLAAGLVQYASCLAGSLPIMILLPLLGGVDPRLVVLVYAATASLAFFLAALSILVSTASRRGVRAIGETLALVSLWCGLPVFVYHLMPRLFPRLSPWVYPVNEWVLASTPSGVMMAAMGGGPGWRFLDSVFRMIGIQLVAGSLLIAWAVARFRGASRDRDAVDEARGRGRSRLLAPFRMRPACGENPVLWKELYTERRRGLARVLGASIGLGLAILVGYGTYRFARPAFLEWFEHGLGPATADVQRTEFNRFLRHVTSWVEFFTLLIAAGVAAEGVTAERARQTWDGLIATPLDGRAILAAKMIGAAWKVRWGAVLLALLWSVGLLAGAVHPLGYAAALVLLGVGIWFMVGLGTFMSLLSRDSAQASNRTLIPVLLLSGSFLVFYLPTRGATILMGAGSLPLVNWLSLMSYRDVGEIAIGRGAFGELAEIGVFTYEGPPRVLATCLLGIVGHAAAAAWLGRAGPALFDRAVGRPGRVEGPRGRHDATARPAPSRTRPWSRGRRRIVLVLVVVPALVALGIVAFSPRWLSERSLRRALDETDRLCPGWRLDDLEAAQARLPEASDAALRVRAADLMLPPPWRGTRDNPSAAERMRLDAVAGRTPAECLASGSLRSLRAALGAVGPALTEARALVDLPEGRFEVHWARDGISTGLPHLAMVHDVANLLACDALLRAQGGDTEGALTTCLALLNASRSIGDEPLLVSQRERIEIRATAARQAEHALAHGQAPDNVLARLQDQLDAEGARPLLARGIQGERALMDRFLASVESGEFTPRQVQDTTAFPMALLLATTATATRTAMLRFYNRAEEIAKLPEGRQEPLFRRLESADQDMPRAARLLAPSLLRAADGSRRSLARLRCAAAALAAERYRLAHGAWPSTLEALVPGSLARVPTDPSAGKPLRYRRLADGVAIDIDIDGVSVNASDDTGFRLWDPPRRHQPAKP